MNHDLSNTGNLVLFYRTLTEEMGEEFDLRDLYKAFKDAGLPHPHLTIRTLREEGHLIETRNHAFTWNL